MLLVNWYNGKQLERVKAEYGLDEKRTLPEFWWKKGVTYSIHIPAFQDSNSDGFGDLNGLRRLSFVCWFVCLFFISWMQFLCLAVRICLTFTKLLIPVGVVDWFRCAEASGIPVVPGRRRRPPCLLPPLALRRLWARRDGLPRRVVALRHPGAV